MFSILIIFLIPIFYQVYLSEVVDRNKVFPVLSSVRKGEKGKTPSRLVVGGIFFDVFEGRGKNIYIHKVREGRKKILGIEPLFELAHVLLCVMLFEEG